MIVGEKSVCSHVDIGFQLIDSHIVGYSKKDYLGIRVCKWNAQIAKKIQRYSSSSSPWFGLLTMMKKSL